MSTTVRTELTDEVVRLDDPSFYIDDPFPIYARMRAEAPVYRYEPLKLWALTRYEDISQVSRHPELFSSERGIVINDIKYDQSMVKSLFPPGAEHLMASDPPRHRALRRLIGVSFGNKGVSALEPEIRRMAAALVEGLIPGEETDWVGSVAAPYPLLVLCAFMGISRADVDELRSWADATTAVGEPRTQEEFKALVSELERCFQFFGGEMASRMSQPADDVITLLLSAEIEGEKLDPQTILMFCQFLLAAAGETTRHLLSGAVLALAEHPDQHAELAAEPSLSESATEEFLRWITPAVGFVRTATEDTTIGSQQIQAGEPVLMLYPAGNRDESVWEDPETFDLTRPPKPRNLAFGLGEHMCLGAQLARLEIRVFLEEFVRRFARVEVVAEPKRQPTTLFTAWDEVRVALHG